MKNAGRSNDKRARTHKRPNDTLESSLSEVKFSDGSLLLLDARLRIVATLLRDETTEKIFRAPRKEAKDAGNRCTFLKKII